MLAYNEQFTNLNIWLRITAKNKGKLRGEKRKKNRRQEK
jgi:hypothetical protein